MRTFLTYSFYLCGVGFLCYEILKTQGLNLFNTLKEYETKAELEKDKNKSISSTDLPEMQDQIAYSILALLYVGWVFAYTLWTLTGLLSSQWVFFLSILVLSFVSGGLAKFFKNYSNFIWRFDAIITVIILVFMFINRFHLHLI